jgi:transcriptional regulator with XRE-family HTH domain
VETVKHETCLICGSTSIRITKPRTYQFRLSGLDNVYLRGGVTRFECRECGEILTRIEAEHQLLEMLAVSLLLKPARLTGREMRHLRRACRYSQDELAGRLGLTRRAIVEREKRVRPGLKDDQEVGLRAVLFVGFMKRLEREGSHLTAGQLKHLRAAYSRFLDLIETLKPQARKERATFARDEDHKRWELAGPGRLAA